MANNLITSFPLGGRAGDLSGVQPVVSTASSVPGSLLCVKQWNRPGGKLQAITTVPTEYNATEVTVSLRLLCGNQRMIDNTMHGAYWNNIQILASGEWTGTGGTFVIKTATDAGLLTNDTTGAIAVTGDSLPTAAGILAKIQAVLKPGWIVQYAGSTVAASILGDAIGTGLNFEFIQTGLRVPSVPAVIPTLTVDVTSVTGGTSPIASVRKITSGGNDVDFNAATYANVSTMGVLLDTWPIPISQQGQETYHVLKEASSIGTADALRNPRKPVLYQGDWLIMYANYVSASCADTSLHYAEILLDQ